MRGRTGPIRVVVCDDQRLMRLAFHAVLTREEDVEIVADAATGTELLELVAGERPDAVLLDLDLPAPGGLHWLEQLTKRHPALRCVALSEDDSPDALEAAFRSGARAYVLKSVDPRDLPAAIRQAVEGCVFQSGGLTSGAPPAAIRAAGLSAKEAVVLAQLAKGGSNRQIAQALWLSEQTVKFHLRNVYRKLGVANRTEALRFALDRHLVDAA